MDTVGPFVYLINKKPAVTVPRVYWYILHASTMARTKIIERPYNKYIYIYIYYYDYYFYIKINEK